ncbi:MAG: ACP S-malonyltransferase [Bacteroidota bacterium]
MIAYVFPGQAAQFEGMGKDLYDNSETARQLFEQANDILGYRLSDVMFTGTAEELKQTRITQPAVFLHSIVKAQLANTGQLPHAVAGHSLGEFSALVASKAMNFEDGLILVKKRALAMQAACEAVEGTMAAILGLDDEVVEKICLEVDDTVVAANYNCPGQLVISGTLNGVEKAVEACKEAGARKAVILQVGGAFHSPLMEPAKKELQAAIESVNILAPVCPIYQNVHALPETDPEKIKINLIKQLTSPVRWTQIMLNMINDGVDDFYEVGGNGKTIRGFMRRVDRRMPIAAL